MKIQNKTDKIVLDYITFRLSEAYKTKNYSLDRKRPPCDQKVRGLNMQLLSISSTNLICYVGMKLNADLE